MPPQFNQLLREINGLTIFFRDKHTVWASDGKSHVYFHRWFTCDRPLGSYPQQWKPFIRDLKRKNNIESLRDLYILALKYDVSFKFTFFKEEIPKGIKSYSRYVQKKEEK